MAAKNNEIFEFVIIHQKKCVALRLSEVVNKYFWLPAEESGIEAKLHNASMFQRHPQRFRMEKYEPVSTPLQPGLDLGIGGDGI